MVILGFVVVEDDSGIKVLGRVDVSFGYGNGGIMNYENSKFNWKRG